MKLRLSAGADRDLVRIARESKTLFGPIQSDRYRAVIDRALDLLLDDPYRASSRGHPEMATGVRSFHLQWAAGRKGAASHVLYYMVAGDVLFIVRVLHEAMEPQSRVRRVLSDERGGFS